MDVQDEAVTSYHSVKVDLVFNAMHRGRAEDRIEFHFEDTSLSQHFAITRPLVAVVDNRNDYETIKPIAPYVRKQWKPREEHYDVVPGVKPEAFAQIKWAQVLPKSDIPGYMSRILASGNDQTIMQIIKNNFLPKTFHEETYSRRFEVLLHVEEYRAE